MLEVGWSEILVIALILIIVVGPKDLPPMLRTFGRMASRLRGMANEFKGQFDQALREAELDDVRKGLSEVNKLNPTNSLRDAMNPIRKFGEDLKSDLKKASDVSTPAATASSIATAETLDDKAQNTVAAQPPTETKPAEPVVAPVMQAAVAPVVPPAVEKAAEAVPAATEMPVAKPKAIRKKDLPSDATTNSVSAAVTTEPKTRKAPVRAKDAAVAAVAAEAAAKKPVTRKQAVVAETAPDLAVAEGSKPKKASSRKTAEKPGDA